MSDELNPAVPPETPPPAPAPEPAEEFAPSWGIEAPRGGKTVVTRALKDGARVPLFLGQTLIQSLRDLGYNSTTSALCEHVDNAIQWGASEVRIYFRQTGKLPNQRIDALVYDNGRGMAPHVLKVAMAFGGSMVFENRSGIGRYGMGMKAAALNVARSVDVYSWQEPGQFYSMTLDVEAIGKDRNNMIELPDPEPTTELPTEVAQLFCKTMVWPKNATDQHLLCEDEEDVTETLGATGTIVYMPNCDRLSFSTARGLVDHATKEMGRIYRRFIDKGVRIYVNNRLVEAFDPTYWLQSARHTKVEGLTETKSSLVDSWTVQVPVVEGSPNTTEVRVRMFLLPVRSWAELPRTTLKNELRVFDDNVVSYVRNGREVDIGNAPKLKVSKHHTNAWLRVEIEFLADADEGFGVAANKQGVRLQQFVADALLEHGEGRFGRALADMRKTIREQYLKATAAKKAGGNSEAERHATQTDSIQQVALPRVIPTTTEEEQALAANLCGLAVSLRREGETEEQAFERVSTSQYLTDFKHQEYAPFYDTDFKFGKLILKVNTAHPFYQKVWQPLAELAKKAIPTAEGEEAEMTGDVAESTRKALLGLELMLLSLARAQTQMTAAAENAEQVALFRNLRKAWSDTLETQFTRV
jgi:hypothetical protein